MADARSQWPGRDERGAARDLTPAETLALSSGNPVPSLLYHRYRRLERPTSANQMPQARVGCRWLEC